MYLLKKSSLKLLQLSLSLSLGFSLTGFAQTELTPTPEQTAGPYYPGFRLIERNGDTDLANNFEAQGVPVVLEGKVVDRNGQAIPNAIVHLWQTDGSFGRYFNDERSEALDENFDYYGKDRSDENGNFQFSTVRPIEYPVGDEWIRPDHIHIRVIVNNRIVLTSQLYFSDDPLLDQDRILQSFNEAQKASVVVEYAEDEELSEEAGKTVLKGNVVLVP